MGAQGEIPVSTAWLPITLLQAGSPMRYEISEELIRRLSETGTTELESFQEAEELGGFLRDFLEQMEDGELEGLAEDWYEEVEEAADYLDSSMERYYGRR